MKAWVIARKVEGRHYGWCLSKNTAGKMTEDWIRDVSRINKFLIVQNALNIAERKQGAFIMELIQFEEAICDESEIKNLFNR